MSDSHSSQESLRLAEDKRREKNWKRWGPYLSERQWGTVREDYSVDGTAWDDFPFSQSHFRAYRWGEDGLLGFSDRECRLCFALSLWNGKDDRLKERLYGLTNQQGNHGEDVKELYYYLDATPTASYLKSAYIYPQDPYPYKELLHHNRDRGLEENEYELLDTGVLESGRYFDISATYAKADTDDILIQIRVKNAGKEKATLHLLPTLWFRNTWSWGSSHEGCELKPQMEKIDQQTVSASHETLKKFFLHAEHSKQWLLTENETHQELLDGRSSHSAYVKDGINRWLIEGESEAVHQEKGTKVAAYYPLSLAGGEEKVIRLRLSGDQQNPSSPFGENFKQVLDQRTKEADDFYQKSVKLHSDAELATVQRQAYAGLIHSKQFYHYAVKDWIKGDVAGIRFKGRESQRNKDWEHLFNRDIISMPDKWEYPWYAAWDLAFHMVAFVRIDPEFAKHQLLLMTREWYQHPNGQIPAYEWNFSDVNPPVHAWAVWRVYKMTGKSGERDIDFLAQCFHKLLINFTWWVNRKDPQGHNLFSGGFLGLDNIGAFDRSSPLGDGVQFAQADGTAWMAFYCTTMLSIALELANYDASYEGVASKFFEHFVAIAIAMNTLGEKGLWHEKDGFYYDLMCFPNGKARSMKIRSLVGLIPLCAVEVLDGAVIDKLPRFKKRMQWFLSHNEIFLNHLVSFEIKATKELDPKIMLSIPTKEQLERVLQYVLDEEEFFSPYGIRSLSRYHHDHPFETELNGQMSRVAYEPRESRSRMFGGNSNWRGPIWMPLNYLLMESLEKYYHFYGDDLQVELPTGSGRFVNLKEVSLELSRRLVSLFLKDEHGNRPIHKDHATFYRQPSFEDRLLFYEFFSGEDGTGCGASHQTGWTALVAKLIEDIKKPS